MRKLLLCISFMGLVQVAEAKHTIIFRNASDLSTGTVSNFLLDGSSVTKQGNVFNSAGLLVQVGANGLIPQALVQVTTSSPRSMDIVIGSPTAPNVDISSNNEDGLKTAIFNMCGSSSVTSCPGGGTVFMRTGVYSMQDTTIPANVKVYALSGSSVVWVIKNTSIPIATVYGELEGITFDFGFKGYAVRMMDLKTGSVGRRLEWRNSSPLSGNASTSLVSIRDSNQVLLTDYITRNCTPNNASTGMIDLDKASATVVQNGQHFGMAAPTGGSASLLYGVKKCSGTLIFNSYIDKWAARYVLIDGGRDNVFDRHFINLTADVGQSAGSGVVMINTEISVAAAVSTHTLISNVDVSISGASDASAVFKVNDAGSKGVSGVIFDHNSVNCTPAGTNTTLPFNVGSGVLNTVFRMNATYRCSGASLTDSGTGTVYANFGNINGSNVWP